MSQIVIRNVETSDSDDITTVKRVVYVLDESGKTFYSFPARLIRAKDETRFVEAVISVNKEIKIY